ncbi:hypothetical protein H072_3385 [Dactylellina haptotyla CBS 200.50]|uniref:RING-type domain-containing protein n=1 Tax=Dactylellina haptotyla (strain CBS 200.50) TaxID=1284197 RepID=S8AID0_DACHA|nr:hypothetical protein H072_3385 [Dactylellina haptotyla CBS 200.50]
MPFPLLKLLFLLISLAVLLLILLYVSLSVNFPLSASPSFFPTSAIISLAEDNSTFFLSKPAAFGPLLPKVGLTGELFVLPESELACDDASPDGFTWRDDKLQDGHEIDSKTDDHIGVKSVEVHADIETLQESAEIGGKIVLMVRGGCGFYDKVLWSQRRGAIAVIVGDNEAHRPLLTMYAKGDTSNISIPAIFTSYTTAHLLTSLLPKHPPKSPGSSSRKQPVYTPVSSKPGRGGLASYFSRNKAPPAEDRSSRDPYGYPAEPKERTASERYSDHDLDYRYKKSPVKRSNRRGNSPLGPHDEEGNSVTDGSVALEGFGWLGQNDDDGSKPGSDKPDMSHGLWITLTPTRLSSSPFVDTLLVLVVSPVITLTVVYTMLLLRSRYRRRRWRAPKSLVDQLPVHTYQPPSDPPSPSAPQNIPSSSSTNQPQHSEKSTPGSYVASSFPDTTQVSTSSSAFPPLTRVSSAPPPTTSSSSPNAKQNSKYSSSRRNMRILPGFKYFPPSPECVVCLEEYVEGVSQVMRLPCGHEFHVNCITPWLTTRRRTCPVCKCDVVKALGGGNGYSSSNGDEENGGSGSDRPIGAVEGRGDRGVDIWWRTFWGALGLRRGDGSEVGERTPLIDGEDDRRRD